MSGWEWLKIARNTSLSSSSGSELIHLPRANQIGMLFLTVRGTNGASENAADDSEQQTVQEALSRIEVFSGGEVLKKYNGYDCRSIATYDTGRLPPETRSQVGGATQESVFPIRFNLDPMDTNVICPAPLMDTLSLEFDYTFSEDADEGFAASGFYYDLYAMVYPPDGDMENKNILVTKTKDTYTTTGAGEKTFDLTIDPRRMLRRVYVDVYEKAIAEGVDITDIELQVDSDRKVLAKWNAIQAMNAYDCGLNWREHILTEAYTTTDVILTRVPTLHHHNYQSYGGTNRDDTEYVTSVAGDAITMVNTAAAAGTLDIASDVIPAFAVIDFDKDLSLRHLQTQNLKNLQLILTDGVAGAAVRILEESIVKKWW